MGERVGAIFLARIEDDSLGPFICEINNQLSLRSSPRCNSRHFAHGSRKSQRTCGFAAITSPKQTEDSFPVPRYSISSNETQVIVFFKSR